MDVLQRLAGTLPWIKQEWRWQEGNLSIQQEWKEIHKCGPRYKPVVGVRQELDSHGMVPFTRLPGTRYDLCSLQSYYACTIQLRRILHR